MCAQTWLEHQSNQQSDQDDSQDRSAEDDGDSHVFACPPYLHVPVPPFSSFLSSARDGPAPLLSVYGILIACQSPHFLVLSTIDAPVFLRPVRALREAKCPAAHILSHLTWQRGPSVALQPNIQASTAALCVTSPVGGPKPMMFCLLTVPSAHPTSCAISRWVAPRSRC